MSETLKINLAKPITSAKILDNSGVGAELSNRSAATSDAEQAGLVQDLDSRKTGVSQVCQTLQGLVVKLNELCDKLLVEHKEEIARLSVEIARKVLMQKVQEGDYEIESIVKEALNNAPTRQDLVVHLNPEDVVECEKLQQNNDAGTLAGIKFVADSNIGRAECMIETPKGTIGSLIDEHLERIAKALKKVE